LPFTNGAGPVVKTICSELPVLPTTTELGLTLAVPGP